jgi:hypothetical protein
MDSVIHLAKFLVSCWIVGVAGLMGLTLVVGGLVAIIGNLIDPQN